MDRPYEDGAERDLLTLASVNAETGMGGIWIYAGTERGLTRLPDCLCRWQEVQPGDAMAAASGVESLLEVTLDDGARFRLSGPGAGGRVTAGAVYADLARLVRGERPVLFGERA